RVLADDQAAVGVDRHAVALVARLRHLAGAVLLVPTPARVAGHVAEEEVLTRRVPDRPLGEREAGADLLDFGRRVDQVVELLRLGFDTHTPLLSRDVRMRAEPNMPSRGVPPLDAAEDLAQPRQAREVVTREEAVDVGERGAHAGGERLVVRVAPERVDPDDGERLMRKPLHLPAEQPGAAFLALPAVRGDHDDGAA